MLFARMVQNLLVVPLDCNQKFPYAELCSQKNIVKLNYVLA